MFQCDKEMTGLRSFSFLNYISFLTKILESQRQTWQICVVECGTGNVFGPIKNIRIRLRLDTPNSALVVKYTIDRVCFIRPVIHVNLAASSSKLSLRNA